MKAWGGAGCNGYNTFCPYVVNNTPMPVELINFDVKCDKLEWATVTEINNDVFTIYYSKNTEEWSKVYVKEGHGNSNTPLMYTLLATNLKTGYYKLTQTDYNGTETEMSIKHLRCKKKLFEKKKYYNLLMQEIDSTAANGITIIVDEEGNTVKVLKLK